MDCLRASFSRKTSGARSQEGMHAVSKFRRVVDLEVSIEDRKASTTVAELKRLEAVSKKGADEI